MPTWLQTILALLIVAACVAFVGREVIRTLFGKRSRIGSCCSKGCSANEPVKPASAAPPTQFLPVELLTRKRS